MKNSEKVLLDIKCLRVGSKLYFTYKDKDYELKCYKWRSQPEKDYGVYPKDSYVSRGMNVERITKKYLSLYDYDMMGNKTTYKMALDEIIVDTIVCVEDEDHKLDQVLNKMVD